ncbi:MAG: hypothetical protein O6951_10595 [Actinobacteria bacterium]|nr:hypothetical protein [Actinomycetota bacterium]
MKHAFDDISGSLKTGDVFLAHGDSLISEVIEVLLWSEWSHSGMVVLAEDIGLNHLSTNILLWESTRSTDLPDIVTGNYKKDPKHPGGAFLVGLRERLVIDSEIGEMPVALRRLETVRTNSMLGALKNTMNDVRNAFFPGDIEFAEDFAKGRLENKAPSSYDHFFCSELVAYTMMKMDLLSDKKVPNYYEPKSYSLENTHGIPLIDGASLGEEIWVDRLSDT